MDFARWDSRERPRGVRAGTPYPSRARMSMLPGPEGHCVGQTISCDDGNSCTDDTCTSTAGCVHTNNSAPCNDGNACTTGDACAGGQCRGGAALNCDDGIACTVDTCDAGTGCIHRPQGVLQTVCSFNPTTLQLSSRGGPFSVDLSIVDACSGGSVPIPPGSIGIVHVSRAGNTVFPDPASIQCQASGGGTGFETGLFEDFAARAGSGNSLSLKFDKLHDGNCRTPDGNRQDLIAALTDVSNRTEAPICVSGMVGGQVFECCTSARLQPKDDKASRGRGGL